MATPEARGASGASAASASSRARVPAQVQRVLFLVAQLSLHGIGLLRDSLSLQKQVLNKRSECERVSKALKIHGAHSVTFLDLLGAILRWIVDTFWEPF